MERASAQMWVNELFAAWEDGDAERAAALFTADAEYRAHPFAKPHRGQGAIEDYWGAALERQSNVEVRVGSPVVDGERVAVEWWVSLEEDGTESTSTGTLFLTFDGEGFCSGLREVWMERPGRSSPFRGWGL